MHKQVHNFLTEIGDIFNRNCADVQVGLQFSYENW